MIVSFKKYLILLTIIAISTLAHSQSRNGLYKFSLPGKSSIVLTGIGPSYLFGDVGGNKDTKGLLAKTDFIVAQTKYMFSVNYRYVFQNNVGFKASALFGKFEGTDTDSRNEARGFDFSTNLNVLAMHIEYNIIGGENSDYGSPHKLYAFVGVGAMISDVDFNSSKPLRTTDSHAPNTVITPVGSGYNAKMVSIAPSFPIGGGYEYELTPSISLGAEYVIHTSFSDYIDGVSTSYSKNKDYLMNLDLTFTYKFGKTGGQNRRRVNWN
jgi:opacity protein-like surface antigen